MLNFIDSYLNKITMYRLVLYFLIVLLAAAVVFSAAGMLAFKPLDLVFSALILLVFCWLANQIFASVFAVPANVESVYITALILALIITPPAVSGGAYFVKLIFLFWTSIWSMGVKYMLAWRGKHFFNPAAFAVALTSLTISQSASWWVGTLPMLPFVIAGGLLVTRKIQRFDLVISFLAAALVSILLLSRSLSSPISVLQKIMVETPIFFFAFIMLTEPLTTPPTRYWRIGYGVFVGLLFGPNIHIGSFYSTPELALLTGNIFAYLASPKQKYMLALRLKEKVGTDTFDFVFRSSSPVKFLPGQYMEWTLDGKKSDSRGNRRYFTIASSPTEQDLRLGVKFYEPSSSFKRAMLALPPGGQILAGQLSGEFTMPKNQKEKLVFIAGGIGITPFRSMLKYLIDRNELRDITLFYSNKDYSEAVYGDILTHAHEKLNIKTVLTLTDLTKIPTGWRGYTGYINASMIAREVPDFKQRKFFVSGPRSMVVAFEKTLKNMNIPKNKIKVDFFPGFV